MAFQISPGVNVTEIDLTTIVPAVATTECGTAGTFRWGPVDQLTLITNEDELVAQYGRPDANTAVDFFTAANFLAYGRSLRVSRAATTGLSSARTGGNNVTFVVKNEENYDETWDGSFGSSNTTWVAKYPGELGNSLKVSVCPSATAFESTIATVAQGQTFDITKDTTLLTFSASVGGDTSTVLQVNDIVLVGPDGGTKQPIKVSAIAANGTHITLAETYTGATVTSNNNLIRRWEYYSNFDNSLGTSTYVTNKGGSGDELHVVVVDEDGTWSGVKGQVLERFPNLSFASDAKAADGTATFYKTAINRRSQYLWWANHDSNNTNAGQPATATFTGATQPISQSLGSGADGASATDAQLITAYDEFKNTEEVDVSFLLASAGSATVVNHMIDNIASTRKDLLVCCSPERADVVNNATYEGKEADDVVAFRNTLTSTSYAVMDSGWKYQFDKYNDVYRWIPCNGDTAGLMVRTDFTNDPWYSPAGFNRGVLKNVVRLAWNPSKSERDELYKNGVNPVTTFSGRGTVLFGDKTLLSKPSAFDRINVRRLFIVLEKAISTAADFTLFEFNDEFTRTSFVNLVEPFLRDVQGRRGITDFRVVCDETNNTPEVIDRNEFVGDIYIKPARSINFIQLNFVAVRTGVEFSEIVGQF